MKATNALLMVVIIELGFVAWNQAHLAPPTMAEMRSANAEDRTKLTGKIPLSSVRGSVDVSGSVDAVITNTVSVEVENLYELER